MYGPDCYAGLDLPKWCTSAGIGQLHLFLGYLRLKNKTANLILIGLSCLQLLIQQHSSSSYLYQIWTHHGWRLACIYISIHQQNQVPNVRQVNPHSPIGMSAESCIDGLLCAEMHSNESAQDLNWYKVHLQVIFMSDIVDAAGTTILNSIKHGQLTGIWNSDLSWPANPWQAASAWSQWRTALAHLEEHGKLKKPLGDWLASSNQH